MHTNYIFLIYLYIKVMGRVGNVTPQEEKYAMKYTRILIPIIAVAAVTTLLWNARANADAIEHYQPNLLTQAERALERGRPDNALGLLEGRVEGFRRPAHQAQAHAVVCRAWYEKGEYHKAERACDAAVQLDGAALAWSHLNNRGVMRLLLGRVDEALADFHAAASKNPQAWSVRRNLAASEEAQRRDEIVLSAVF